MAELRHATRAYLAEGHGPAAVIDRLNRLMQTLIPGEIATICLLAIDITTGRVRLANAGHPPPLHRSGGRVRRDHRRTRRCSASRCAPPARSSSIYDPATRWCSTPTA